MPKNNLKIIVEHVTILNKEVGKLQIDIAHLKTSMKWIFRIIGYMAALLTLIVIKSFF